LDEITKQAPAAQELVAVIMDGCALRYGVASGVKDFLKKRFPVFIALMGESGVDESYERYGVPLTCACADIQGGPIYPPLNRLSNRPH